MIGVVLVGLGVVLIVGADLYLGFAGERVWRKTEDRLRDFGEPLVVADIEPAPVADGENFAAAPIFAETFVKPKDDWRIRTIESFAGGYRDEFSDLVNAVRTIDPDFTGRDSEAARIVLSAAESQRDLWDEIREANERPGTRWPVDFSDGLAIDLGGVVSILTLGQSLSAQIRAFLALGNVDAARARVMLLLDLADRVKEAPTVIASLIRESIVMLAVTAICDGITEGLWSDEALVEIGDRLADVHFAIDLQQSMREERVLFTEMMLGILRGGAGVPEGDSNQVRVDSNQTQSFRGYLFRGLSKSAAMTQELIEAMNDLHSAPGVVDGVAGIVAEAKKESSSRLKWAPVRLANLLLPSYYLVARRTIYDQARVDQTIVAIAIERFRLRNGRLPGQLRELVPDFLEVMPPDLVTRHALRYRAADDATGYLLYSVGWNQVDDGGSSVRPKERAFDKAEDWVWGVE